MNQQHGIRRSFFRSHPGAMAGLRITAFLIGASMASIASAQDATFIDTAGDARIIRTDPGGDGPVDPQLHALPDLLYVQMGRFAPAAPHVNIFAGDWTTAGGFVRIDLVFAGLVNPPGPLAYDDDDPEYAPFLYGPHPVFGYVEIDLDADENTGGELSDNRLRYNGAIARFGGLPSDPRFANRVALNRWDYDSDIITPPFVDRSGEEFHIALLGEEVDDVEVDVERPGGDPEIFEAGEVWRLEGDWFHRAHGWESFLLMCPPRDGRYKPDIYLRFAHDEYNDETTVSLVYPLTNAASAAMESPGEPVEPNNGCDHDQNSVLEALTDLWFSAVNADPWTRQEPEFILLAGWEYTVPADQLDPSHWRVNALLGTAYPSMQESNARHVWTDALPDVKPGDFNGDGCISPGDAATLSVFIAQYDGQSNYDDDGDSSNGSIDLYDFARNFSLYDSNYDGFCNGVDAVIAGDMNLSGALDMEDVAAFVMALLEPGQYWTTFGVDPLGRGDMNCDGALDGRDVAPFTAALLGTP